jgi:hypothetical protein
MTLRSCGNRSIPSFSPSFTTSKLVAKAAALGVVLAALSCAAQDETQAPPAHTQNQSQSATATLPAGTRLPLVLTQPIQSRLMRRGDDIYAQINAPVDSGEQMVIPPGTFVQGTLDKFERHGHRGELRLESMSLTFPDGYVTSIPGPLTLETSEGYVLTDSGRAGLVGAFLPVVGAGVGLAIGSSFGTGVTPGANLPPGCITGTMGCIAGPPVHHGNNEVFGAAIGGAAGTFVGLGLMFRHHNFLLDPGAPAAVTLENPVSFSLEEVSKAVKQSADHPVAMQPVAPVPLPPAPPIDSGPPNIPSSPGTLPIVIPGPPGPGGVPGPPIIIPGTPPSGG